MDVKPGYKQTEVGMIPEDWEVKRLGQLATITAGGTPSRTNAQYWNGDIPWITTSEVDFYTIDHAEQFITKEGLNNSAAKLLPAGKMPALIDETMQLCNIFGQSVVTAKGIKKKASA